VLTLTVTGILAAMIEDIARGVVGVKCLLVGYQGACSLFPFPFDFPFIFFSPVKRLLVGYQGAHSQQYSLERLL
jgi:hypothetical protein